MLRWRMLRHGAHQREQSVVVGIERAPDVDEAAAEDAFDELALLRQLADGLRLALLRVHVVFGARDVQIAAEHAGPAVCCERRGVGVQRLEEAHLGREVFAAVRHVDRTRRSGRRASHGGDAVFEVELRMRNAGRSAANDRLTCRPTPE